ncbi:MAG: GNAT family N-acetyltransferase, partial [Streptosporangiaceae bacterium]
PGYQRAGHGRALVETFLQAAAAADAPSCHLAVYTANTAARRFYAKLGWHHVPAHNPGPWSPMADLVGKLPLRWAATAIRWHRGGSSQIARERRWSWSSGCSGRWWSVTARDR